MIWLFIFCISMLGVGLFVDWWNKKHGLEDFDPEENNKHVSESERVYMESYMHNQRNDHDNGLF